MLISLKTVLCVAFKYFIQNTFYIKQIANLLLSMIIFVQLCNNATMQNCEKCYGIKHESKTELKSSLCLFENPDKPDTATLAQTMTQFCNICLPNNDRWGECSENILKHNHFTNYKQNIPCLIKNKCVFTATKTSMHFLYPVWGKHVKQQHQTH